MTVDRESQRSMRLTAYWVLTAKCDSGGTGCGTGESAAVAAAAAAIMRLYNNIINGGGGGTNVHDDCARGGPLYTDVSAAARD